MYLRKNIKMGSGAKTEKKRIVVEV